VNATTEGPGARLAAARERRGFTTAQIAETLHVDVRVVVAMEANDFGAFDAPVYARGYLRKYAALLELAPEEILESFNHLTGTPASPALLPTVAAAPVHSASARGAVIALGAIALIGLAVVSVWLMGRGPSRPKAPASAPPPVATPAPAPASVAEEPLPPPPIEPKPAPPPARAIPERRPEPATPQPVRVQSAPAAPAATAPAVTAPAATGTELLGVLELSFAGDCWLEVYGNDGRRLFYDLGHAGETHRVMGFAPWRVFVGNVENVQLSVHGQRVIVGAQRRFGATARFHLAADGHVS
jgi:cytoskeleton protein RodZ